jgi:HPt (histidine-containing phosphotransfer) domain-containing protein
MGDAAVAERVTRKFATRIMDQIGEVESYLTAGASADARVIAHAIKGGAWNLNSAALGEVAKAVEDASADGDISAALERLGPLRREAARFIEYVNAVDFADFM